LVRRCLRSISPAGHVGVEACSPIPDDPEASAPTFAASFRAPPSWIEAMGDRCRICPASRLAFASALDSSDVKALRNGRAGPAL